MSNKKVTKLNQYFYMTPEGEILKYKKYCIINDCKKLSSYNYSDKKEFLYCNEHKLDKMINVRKGYLFCEEHTLECKYCNCKFNHAYNDRCIILNEIVDKEKLQYILDNNDFDLEVNNLAKNYYDSLDDLGRKRIGYKQTHKNKNRYYAVGSCLSYLKREIRNSIMPKNIKDIDMINCHPVILLNLCQKNEIICNILKNYVENRDIILDSFGDNRKSVKEMFLTVLNGGFKDKYSEDPRINNYLKLLEKEVVKIQEYFYSKDKRYFEKGFNYMGKKLIKNYFRC